MLEPGLYCPQARSGLCDGRAAGCGPAYRFYFKKAPLEGGGYTMDHTAIVYLMDEEGRFVSPFSLKRTTEAAAADLRWHL